MSVQVKGLGALRAKLARIRSEVDDATDEGLAAGAMAIKVEARRRVPRLTDELHDSIEDEKQGHHQYAVGTNLFRAHFPEFGTRFQPAKPYLFPAYEMLRLRIVGAMLAGRLKAAIRGVVR